jgi:deoxyadenosine/deoxycytidine kinase
MIISLEGNIGSGKSTLLQSLKSYFYNNPNIIFIEEDVDTWNTVTDSNGVNILQHFYNDKQKYGFMFQSFVILTRIHKIASLKTQHPNAILVLERSPISDYKMFAEALYDNKEITEIEWKTYQCSFQMLQSIYPIHSTTIFYLFTEPDVCMKRICKRNRKGEELIPSHYIHSLHLRHEKWLRSCDTRTVCVLNGNLDESDKEYATQFNQIVAFLRANCK